MAIMIPREPPERGPGRKAEFVLWQALAAGLDDNWFVYWSFAFLDEAAREGEVDFLLLHRVEGLFSIECKGDGVRLDGAGRWWRGDEPMRKSPFAQSRANMHALVDQLTRRWRRQQADDSAQLPLVFGDAVAFPRGSLADVGLLPVDVKRSTLLQASDLGDITGWVVRLAGFWAKASTWRDEPLTSRAFKRFRKSVVHPTFGIIERIGSRLAADERDLVRASAEQMDVMEHLLLQPRMRVTGGAGTGKTALALEAARRHAETGKDVLFMCFNKGLAAALRDRLRGETFAGNVTIQHFHSLCWQECKRLTGEGLPVPSDRADASVFWAETAPNYVLDSICAETAPRYDAIIADEAQDLLPSWWVVLQELLRDPDSGVLAVFGDPEQDIFGRGGILPDVPAYPLTLNFRNTKAIAKVVAELGCNNSRPWRGCPEGVEPVTAESRGSGKDRRAVSELVKRLVDKEGITPDRIVILTPHRRQNSLLAGLDALGDLPLADNPTDRDGKVLHTTLSAFKGLESDVVILADIDIEDERANRRARYVAASRARHLLYVWSKGDWRCRER